MYLKIKKIYIVILSDSVKKVDIGRSTFDILVNSYMRSGSSFTGQLLAFRPGTFYWYEPLWQFHSGVYYWGPDKICMGQTHCQ